VVHDLALTAVMPNMLWGSPIWWIGSAAVTSTLASAYHRIARWITGLPMSTRIPKLLTAPQLPPLNAYLDYVSMRYAIWVRFLPTDHMLADSPAYVRGMPKPGFPSRHRPEGLISHLTIGELEDRSTHIDTLIPRVESPHRDKHTDPTGIHKRWIQSLPDFTILLYTDGSKLEDRRNSSGWVIYCVQNEIARKILAGRCHHGTQAEVFDAELHAAQDALDTLQGLNTPTALAYLCMDNQSALNTLHGNASSTQYSRTTAAIAANLCAKGWKIMGTWTPTHVGIEDNEAVDSEAKAGAKLSAPCKHAPTTRTWMQAQTRRRLRERWVTEHPNAVPSSKFPEHLRSLSWSATLWRLYARRTPSDRDPGADQDKEPEPCNCGKSFVSSAHILLECRLFLRARSRLLQKAPDVTVSSVLRPEHVPAVMEFMKTTELGLTAGLHADDGDGGGSEGDERSSEGRGAAAEEEEGEGTDDEGDDE
jgi:ribonuclease HI